MVKLVIATRNKGKFEEIRDFLGDMPISFVALSDYPDCPDSKEPYASYLENARDKARLVARYCDTWALADDSGLEVEALEWRPGVQSARYAGDHPTYQDNIQKLLKELRDVPREKRRAVFRCCMVLFHPDGRERVSHGELWGVIRETPAGSHGFGYDPVFEIPEAGRTLAQMSLREKNKISHRVRALDKMKQHLQEILVP